MGHPTKARMVWPIGVWGYLESRSSIFTRMPVHKYDFWMFKYCLLESVNMFLKFKLTSIYLSECRILENPQINRLDRHDFGLLPEYAVHSCLDTGLWEFRNSVCTGLLVIMLQSSWHVLDIFYNIFKPPIFLNICICIWTVRLKIVLNIPNKMLLLF